MQATSFSGASVSSKRVAFSSTRRCSHVVQAATALPTQVRGTRSSSSTSSSSMHVGCSPQLHTGTLTPCLLDVQFKAVKPVGDRVLVKVDKEEQKSVGGVLLPTAAQSRPTAGAVVAAGDVNMVKVRVAVEGDQQCCVR